MTEREIDSGTDMHTLDMIVDLQYGSTGKGLIAGHLAMTRNYDTAVCAFATNAGHTYINRAEGINMMTQQLPTSICSPKVKNILLGPGALIHPETLAAELDRYSAYMVGKRLIIHPQACVVENYHKDLEIEWGMSKMGSTTKGVGAAAIERIRRSPKDPVTARPRLSKPYHYELDKYVVTESDYRAVLDQSESCIVEGAQGFGLSMYHGFYPFTTSRDVTPWQIAADCGLPFKWAPYINVVGTLRTFPIRVNNRDGTSGPGYPDQEELSWESLGIAPELTTVTKLPRRIFTFSDQQLVDALWHCGTYYQNAKLFLNFANYHGPDKSKTEALIKMIETPRDYCLNVPKVEWIGYGPDDSDIVTRDWFDAWPESEGGEL